MDVSPLQLSLSDAQIRDILRVTDELAVLSLRVRYGRFRPAHWRPTEMGRGGSWLPAWRYAIRAVISDLRSRVQETPWRKMGGRHPQHARRRMRRQFIKLYRCVRKQGCSFYFLSFA